LAGLSQGVGMATSLLTKSRYFLIIIIIIIIGSGPEEL
jgi:hypothetical protein